MTPSERLPVFLEMVLEEVGTAVLVLLVECVSLVVLPPIAVSSMIFFNDVILLVLLIDIIVVSVMTDGESEVTLEETGTVVVLPVPESGMVSMILVGDISSFLVGITIVYFVSELDIDCAVRRQI